MALDKTGLKSAIQTIATTLVDYDGTTGKTQADALEKFATDLSNAIDTFVKTGEVSIKNVTVTTYPQPGSGTGTIS